MRPRLLALTVLLVPAVASAQPAPTPPPPPPPTGGTAPSDATAPPAEATAPSTVETPAPVETSPATEPEADDSIKLKYDKGIVFESADGAFEAKLSLRTQFRLESTRPFEDGAEWETHLVIPRARLQLEGHVFGDETRYKLEFGLGDRGSFSFVKDLYVERKLGELWLRVGQWKRPFNRQEIVSDFGSVFNERAITAEFVGGGRDIGVAVHNNYEKSPEGLEWVVGVFNGFDGGADRPQLSTTCTADAAGVITCKNANPSNFPTDFGPAVVARAGWNSPGVKGYSEGDLDGGPLRYAVGASYKIDLADLSEGAEDSVADNLSHGVQVDALVDVEGFDAIGGVYLMKRKSESSELGAFVQAGYFLTPKQFQVAARGAVVEEGDRKLIEARAAANYYLHGHALKWANDVGILQLTGRDADGIKDKPDLQIRSMVQMTF